MATAAVALLSQSWLVVPAGAAGLKAYSGHATAEGVRLIMSAQNAPVTNTPIDGTAPIAHAALDSLGSSEAFASSPYPGYYAIAGPGLLRALTQGQLDLPGYPLYARSEHPAAPQQQVDNGLVALKAESAADRSQARARFGHEPEGGTASGSRQLSEAAVHATEGRTEATAEAASSVYQLQAGPLALTEFESVARITRSGSGGIDRSSTSTGRGAFGPVEFAVTDKGLLLGGQAVPGAPAGLVEAITAPGASLQWLRPESDERRVRAPLLVLTFSQPVPGNISPVGATVIVGRAEASLTTESTPPEEETAPAPSAPPGPALPPSLSDGPRPAPPGERSSVTPVPTERARRPALAARGTVARVAAAPPTPAAPSSPGPPSEDAGATAPMVITEPAGLAAPAPAALARAAGPASYQSTYTITALAGCGLLGAGAIQSLLSRKGRR
jgi:hypothetical protein